MKDNPDLDYSRCFWQGVMFKLRPLRLEDVLHSFTGSLDSPTRRVLQLGIKLPSSEELQAALLEKYVGCKDANGVIVFAINNLQGDNVGSISYHNRDRKNGTFSFGIVIDRQHRRRGHARDAVRIPLRYGFWERTPTPTLPLKIGGSETPTPGLPQEMGGSETPTPTLPLKMGGSVPPTPAFRLKSTHH